MENKDQGGIGAWLHRRADDFMALLMAVTFCIFILQIITRYLAKYQMGGDFIWTLDLTSSCMLWMVFFGGGFVLAESDHVKFDMIYNMAGSQGRRIMSIITSLAIAGLFLASLPAVWKYLSFLQMIGKPNATLKWPFSGGVAVSVFAVYSVYLGFAVATIWRYGLRAVRLIMGATPESLDGNPLDAEAARS